MSARKLATGESLYEVAHRYCMQTYNRLPVTMVRGSGVKVWDEKGRAYLDFIAGMGANSLGHCHPVVTRALTEQAQRLIQVGNSYYNEPSVQLAQLLAEHSCFDKVYFCNTGAEANETAVKLARRYGKLKMRGAWQVITAINSFHGRTLAMTSATGQPAYQALYTPVPAGFINVEFNKIDAIKAVTDESVCAVMLEPIQGEGGMNFPDEDYLRKVRAWCDESKVPLILDEVLTGIGRAGALFAFERYGIEPDIVTLGKGIASGIAIGVVATKEEFSVFKPGDHGSTFSGSPLVCAVAHAVLAHIIEKDLAEHARQVGGYFLNRLRELKAKHPLLADVRGRGLLLALEFDRAMSDEFVRACLEEGLLVNKVRTNSVRFMPPLVVCRDDIDGATEIVGRVLGQLSSRYA